jgi:integrase/recombinase XerD
MGQGKQAKILTSQQIRTALKFLETTRYPERDRCMFLLSCRAGLRAKSIAELKWRMLTDAEGNIGDVIELENVAGKGKSGGCIIPINKQLKAALIELNELPHKPGDFVITSERDHKMSAGSVTMWFRRHYQNLGFDGCSSHSGRRTFITMTARKTGQAGGSMRDIQQIAAHASLQTTQRYIEGSSDAKMKVVNLI